MGLLRRMERPKKTRDCTLILLFAVIVLVRGFPMDTQSYGLFYLFLFLCFWTRSLGAMNGLLCFSFSFTFLYFPFFFYSAFQKKDFYMGDLYYHQWTRGGDTETRGIFPSRDTQRYHFGRVASKRGGGGGAEHKIGDDKVARLSVLHDFYFYFSFPFFSCLGFNVLWQYGFITEWIFFRN